MSMLQYFANASPEVIASDNGSDYYFPTIGTSAIHQFAATIFGLIDDAPEQWARQVVKYQDQPQMHQMQASTDFGIASPYLKSRPSTGDVNSAHDSGYGPPPVEFLPELDFRKSTDTRIGHNASAHNANASLVHATPLYNESRSSLLSLGINERGFIGVGTRPDSAPVRNSDTPDSPPRSGEKSFKTRIKHGQDRISACISDFCRPPSRYEEVASHATSPICTPMLQDFPSPSQRRNISAGPFSFSNTSSPPSQALQGPQTPHTPTHSQLHSPATPRPSPRKSIKGIFKSIKQRLSAKDNSDPSRHTTYRGSVLEQGSIIVTPYDVVEWRQNGRRIHYLPSPRVMREGMLLASREQLI